MVGYITALQVSPLFAGGACSGVDVELVEVFLGLVDDEHPEALRLPSAVARLEEEAVRAGLCLFAGVGDAAAAVDESESVGRVDPFAVGIVGGARRLFEVRGDQESLVFPVGHHHHLNEALELAAVMLFHGEHPVTWVRPVNLMVVVVFTLH